MLAREFTTSLESIIRKSNLYPFGLQCQERQISNKELQAEATATSRELEKNEVGESGARCHKTLS